MKITHCILGAATAAAAPLIRRDDAPRLQLQRTFAVGDIGYAFLTEGAKPGLADAVWPELVRSCDAYNVSSKPSPDVPDKFLINAADGQPLQLFATRITDSDAQTCVANATIDATHRYTVVQDQRLRKAELRDATIIGAIVGAVPWLFLTAVLSAYYIDHAPKRLKMTPPPDPLIGIEHF